MHWGAIHVILKKEGGVEAVIYLERFFFPTEEMEDDYLWDKGNICKYYPFRVLSHHHLTRLDFEEITILYGGNGCGKSTALNVIAEKTGVSRSTRFNTSDFYQDFVDMCGAEAAEPLPESSKIITSDGVFDFMLDVRALNEGIGERREEAAKEYLSAKYADFHFRTMADYDRLKQTNRARRKTLSKYVKGEVMQTIDGRSNGESAFQYFTEKIEENGLYILDEPENSLSPKRQMELKQFIEDSVRFFGCQFIISTHSPFLLAMENARIYDLDADPACVRKWTELENVKVYYNFFRKHQQSFSEDG